MNEADILAYARYTLQLKELHAPQGRVFMVGVRNDSIAFERVSDTAHWAIRASFRDMLGFTGEALQIDLETGKVMTGALARALGEPMGLGFVARFAHPRVVYQTAPVVAKCCKCGMVNEYANGGASYVCFECRT